MIEECSYLIISGARVENCNAESNQFIIGFPATTTFTGYGHWLERLLTNQGRKPWVQVEGVGVISHSFSLQPGHPKCPPALYGMQGVINPPIIEEVKSNMHISLIFRIVPGKSVDLDEVVSSFRKEWMGRLKSSILSSFLGGGNFSSLEELYFCRNETFLLEKFREMKKGHFLQERTDLLEGTEEEEDALDRIMTCLMVKKEQGKRGQRNQSGWIVPIAVGFQAIEEPQIRGDVRNQEYSHVYAEPILGLGEFVSVRKRLNEEDFSPDESGIFWVYQIQEENRLYYTKTLT